MVYYPTLNNSGQNKKVTKTDIRIIFYMYEINCQGGLKCQTG